MLRKRIRDVVPRCLAADENMARGFHAGIGVEGPKREADYLGVVVEASQQARAAFAAKTLVLAGRRFVKLDRVLSRYPFPILRRHFGSRAEGRSMKLSTHRTMAIQDIGQRAVDPILDASAETTTAMSHELLARIRI